MTEKLLAWYRSVRRDLPWRQTGDPYRILVSEVMLQQTRVQAALPYYERFVTRFPTAEALAAADEAEVLACWSGLGYYSRARNLQKAARIIAAAGGFPSEYRLIRALPGVGNYTAAAIASIAFGLPHAVVDGNVLRVVARLRNDASDIASPRTREEFRRVAQEWLDPLVPGEFNQALMELGATVCVPRDPLCLLCPVREECRARAAGTQNQLPVKRAGPAVQRISGELAMVQKKGRVLLWQRPAGSSRMAGFWDLPSPEQLPGFRRSAELGKIRHTITHHHYELAVIAGDVRRAPHGFRWYSVRELPFIPLSTVARKALSGVIAKF